MHTRKELLEERGAISEEIQTLAASLNDEKPKFEGDELEKWGRLNARFDEIAVEINRADSIARAEAVAAETGAPSNGPSPSTVENGADVSRMSRDEEIETSALAFQGWARSNAGLDLRDEHRDALERVGSRAGAREFEVDLGPRPTETRAQSHLLGTLGAYSIPEGFIPRIEVALKKWGGVRQNAEILRTSTGQDLPWPTCDSTSQLGELIGENQTVAAADIVFGVRVVRAYKYSSREVACPVELLEDSAIDLVGFIADRLGERIGRITKLHYTNGSPSGPSGIVPDSGTGVTAASPTAFTADEIIELVHSVDPAYREFGAAPGFMMSDGCLALVRKLTDGDGRYLWAPDVQGMSMDGGRLLGWPITINQDMVATPASTEKSILFGDLAAYKVREVRGLTFRQLYERRALEDQVSFVSFLRTDGFLLNAGTNPVMGLLH